QLSCQLFVFKLNEGADGVSIAICAQKHRVQASICLHRLTICFICFQRSNSFSRLLTSAPGREQRKAMTEDPDTVTDVRTWVDRLRASLPQSVEVAALGLGRQVEGSLSTALRAGSFDLAHRGTGAHRLRCLGA